MTEPKEPDVLQCPRCIRIDRDGRVRGGQIYSEMKYDPKSDRWCLQCGEYIPLEGFQTLPYVARMDDSMDRAMRQGILTLEDLSDKVVEHIFENRGIIRTNDLVKKFGVSSHEVVLVLQRLHFTGFVTKVKYGPGDRWEGYRRVDE